MDEQSLADFYRTDYRSLYSGDDAAGDEFIKWQERRGEKIHSFVAHLLPDDAKIADVGCGAGGALLPFVARGHSAIGCDLGEDYLSAGRALGLDLREGDLSTLVNDGPYDLVIMSHVLEHIPRPADLLRDVKNCLSDGGILYIELPGIHNISGSYGDPLLYFQNAHLWNFDLANLTSLLATSGFRLLVGDEFIHAAFTPGHHEPEGTDNAYDRIASSLASSERRRRVAQPLRVVRNRVRDWVR